MSLYGVRILVGDVQARLRDLPDESVHCVVTSPPYWLSFGAQCFKTLLFKVRTMQTEMLAFRYQCQIRQFIVEGITVYVVDDTTSRNSPMRDHPHTRRQRNPFVGVGNLDKSPAVLAPGEFAYANGPYWDTICGNSSGRKFGTRRAMDAAKPFIPRHKPRTKRCRVGRMASGSLVPAHRRSTAFRITPLTACFCSGDLRWRGFKNLATLLTDDRYSIFSHTPHCTSARLKLQAGTTALVAVRLQRHAILIELNPEYAAMARKRIEDDSPLFARVEVDDGV